MSFEVRIDGQLSARGADGREVRGEGTVVLAAAEVLGVQTHAPHGSCQAGGNRRTARSTWRTSSAASPSTIARSSFVELVVQWLLGDEIDFNDRQPIPRVGCRPQRYERAAPNDASVGGATHSRPLDDCHSVRLLRPFWPIRKHRGHGCSRPPRRCAGGRPRSWESGADHGGGGVREARGGRPARNRYEGSDADERRLFYVALTRARDWVSVSRHERVTSQRAAASPYYDALRAYELDPAEVRLPAVDATASTGSAIELTFSELDAFLDCAMAYRLRNLVGFQPRLAPELGYGKAVHHVLRAVAERTRVDGAPSPHRPRSTASSTTASSYPRRASPPTAS